jgi:hypothetical protein
MKKLYKMGTSGNFRKGVLAASVMGALFMADVANAQYCSSGPWNTWDDEIFRVSFSTLNNVSSCNSNQGGPGSISRVYSDYTTVVPTLSVMQTVNYPLSVVVGQCDGNTYSGYVGVWIDYNQNNSFNDPGEQVFMSGSNLWQVNGTLINAPAGVTIPPGATLGATRMRVVASEYNIPSPCGNYGYGETEDYAVHILPNTPCNNTPAANVTTASETFICPNSNVTLGTVNSYFFTGINYQWHSSTQSNLGPWTAVNSATNANYNAVGISQTTWYTLVATCANGGSPTGQTLTAIGVTVAATSLSTVPYFEGFEDPNKSGNNQLPNCSWTRSNANNCKTSTVSANSNRTPYNGVGYANFDYGGNYTNNIYNYYSNGIQLNAGVTYSAWVYYITPGWNAYNNFTLKYGPNQNQTGMVTLGTVPSPNNSTYKLLSNTFQVATSGIYYLNVSAQDNSSGSFFTFDDLGIIAPCTFTNNSANLTINGPSAICTGQAAVFNANGVDSYSWSTGATSQSISVSPINNMVYSVVGTNTLSNCKSTTSLPLIVNPLPGVQIYAPKTSICEGESLVLFASGSANSYTWNTGAMTPMNTFIPAASGTFSYSVVGENSFGCKTVATQVISVNSLPLINVTGNTNICKGEAGTLVGTNADSFTWSSPSSFLQTTTISPYPLVSTAYTVTGTDQNGCKGTTVVYLTVNECTGITNITGTIEGLEVYPNPNSGEFTIQLNNGLTKTIEVVDVAGRIISLTTSTDNQVKMNINHLSNGVYYIKVNSDNAVEVLKVVKQ